MGRKKILEQWLARGDEELRSALFLSTMRHPTPDETICYLCQQSAEKYLKAYIFLQGVEPEKTHILEDLLKICIEYKAEFSTLLSKTIFLTKYTVLPRYPNELGITDMDMKTALQYAGDIQQFILMAIKETETNDSNK